ncbi:hypothetical protein DXG01_011393 [Tephrocybe rancida]|nr:hypothetical protein DXG01_011393 [Tephrocybe rancida]
MPLTETQLRQKRGYKLPGKLEVTVRDATRAPSLHLRSLITALQFEFSSWVLHPRVVDVFMKQFDSPLPSTLKTPAPKVIAHALIGAMLAIEYEGSEDIPETLLSA